MCDRYLDLLKQGFMRGVKARKPKAVQPIVSCEDCMNWHRKGTHTATPAERAERRRERKAKVQR